jgi:galactofuranose transport system ATP-binding protein
MALDGTSYTPLHPRDAVASRVAFLSEDRKADGIIPDLSVRENLTLAALPTLTRFGIVNRKRQRAIVDEYIRRFGIKASSAEQPVRELSGGNQQKVLLARWLCTRPALFIVDEPTRGIDVGARAEVQTLIHELAADGLGVLMISSDLEELVDGSTRVVVLRDGCDVAEIESEALMDPANGQAAIVHAMAQEPV